MRGRLGRWLRGGFRFVFRKTVAGIVVLATLASLLGFSFFRPRIGITMGAPLDPANPFTVPFYIRNGGNTDLNKVVMRCRVVRVEYVGVVVGDDKPDPGGGYLSVRSEPMVPVISPTQQVSSFCRLDVFQAPTPLQNAKMAVTVEFRPSFWPFRQEQRFDFDTTAAVDRRFYWLPTVRS